MHERPPVSVVVPFIGTDDELRQVIARLEALRRRSDDELIVADNRSTGTAAEVAGSVVIQPAGGARSPGFARNRGVARARADWVVFLDADTEPDPDLLEAFFTPGPGPRTAVLGGAIIDVLPQEAAPASLASRHIVAVRRMAHGTTLGRPRFPYAQSANCAVRRSAFVAVGGFEEGIRAAEDADLCFRLAQRGWGIENRPAAVVRHLARDGTAASLRQLALHGAGAGWCNRRHPGSFPPPSASGFAARLARSAARAARRYVAGDHEGAAFAALEILEASAFELGRLLPNRARR